ncbi:MAG TPA: BON domain-containing protein [Methylobacter sp.]|jgi:hyperosmotically inducible protein
MKIFHENRSTELARHGLMMVCLSAVLGLAGCEQKGSADKAEQKVERAAETAEQKIDRAKDQAEKEIDAAKESATDQTSSAGAAVDDAAITAKVKSAILTDPLLKGSNIEVTTVNGVVTLSGTVNEEPDIARAIDVAKTQRDVKSVQSSLVVKVMPDKM